MSGLTISHLKAGEVNRFRNVEPASDDETCVAHLLSNGFDSVLLRRGDESWSYQFTDGGAR